MPPRTIDGPQNPDEFDYKTFLAHRQSFHQHYVRAGQWLTEARTARRDPIYYATEARRWTLEVINRIVQGARERAIVAAFVIGVTDGIDDDWKKAYAAGGARHALAVSGMHVSILYGVLLFLLKPMEHRRAGKWTVAILSLSLLWMYGFVTGLTPSVLRAVTMFSFVAMAKPLGRSGSILNTLAASAFVLILFDPWLICAAGFQLSYLAVLGIVLLYRPIYHLMEFRWAWADWIWQITCVSIAAQVATLPVTLYDFHQFPPWFLLANLFVIPASTVILLGGILLPAKPTPNAVPSSATVVAEAQYKSMSITQLASAIEKDLKLADTVKVGNNEVQLSEALKDKDFRKDYLTKLEKVDPAGTDMDKQIAMVKAYETALERPQQVAPATKAPQQSPHAAAPSMA